MDIAGSNPDAANLIRRTLKQNILQRFPDIFFLAKTQGYIRVGYRILHIGFPRFQTA